MGPSGQIILGPTGQFTVGPTGQIIVAYWKSRADTMLELSQNNEPNKVACTYVYGIIFFIC